MVTIQTLALPLGGCKKVGLGKKITLKEERRERREGRIGKGGRQDGKGKRKERDKGNKLKIHGTSTFLLTTQFFVLLFAIISL